MFIIHVRYIIYLFILAREFREIYYFVVILFPLKTLTTNNFNNSKKMLNKLALGTVQLGIPYGAANKNGKPDRASAIKIIENAIASGISHIDTASAYGDSEEIIGAALKNSATPVTIATKLSPLEGLKTYSSTKEVTDATIKSVHNSVDKLVHNLVDILMLHRWNHRYDYDGAIWNALLKMQKEGLIKTLGASVSTPEEALQAIADPKIGFIQLPANILDYRWQKNNIDKVIAKRPDLKIQARSVLLQGILGANPNCWPKIDGVDARKIIQTIDELAEQFRRKNRIDLCYAYVGSLEWVSSIVVGMETLGQLEENIALFSKSPLTAEQRTICREKLPVVPERLLNPALWGR